MPNVPTLSSTPISRTDVPGFASAAASGSQVWKGHSGAFTAKARKKPRNSSFCVSGSMSRPASERKSKVPSPMRSAETT